MPTAATALKRANRVLLLSDDPGLKKLFASVSAAHAIKPSEPSSTEAALKQLASQEWDICLLDVSDGPDNRMNLLKDVLRRDTGMAPEVIVVTTRTDLGPALRALRMGVCDYLTKPVDKGDLARSLAKALERWKYRKKEIASAYFMQREGFFPELIGNSPATEQMRKFIRKAATSDAPVLLLGETGTGKELVARQIHLQSPRALEPLITLDCASLSETLHAAQLFGHEKGAFTGADQQRRGIFEIADGGTLYLDEVGNLHPSAQAGLLRVLESGEFRRIGGTVNQRADVRVVATTCHDLETLSKDGRFRRDLYYRLGAIVFSVPNLSERRQDIPALAKYFLERLKGVRERMRFTDEASKLLAQHAWTGNVRELRNFVERLVLLSDTDEITGDTVRGLLPKVEQPARTQSDESLEAVEKAHLARILDHYGWNKTRAAKALKISVRTLYNKINLYNLKP